MKKTIDELAAALRTALTWESRLNEAEQSIMQGDRARWMKIKKQVIRETGDAKELLARIAREGRRQDGWSASEQMARDAAGEIEG